jgi:hypothetical protein
LLASVLLVTFSSFGCIFTLNTILVLYYKWLQLIFCTFYNKITSTLEISI